MNLKKLLKAGLRLKNFALLIAVIALYLYTTYIPFMFIGLAGYVYFVMQTLKDPDFEREYHGEEKLDGIEHLSSECEKLYKRVRFKLDSVSRQRIKAVLHQKQELMDFFSRDRDDVLNQKIIEQALNLGIVYIKLLYNYSMRQKELSTIDAAAINARINSNNRKLGLLESYEAVINLTKAIELDEKLMESLKEEKSELEQIHSKLSYIESTISSFKHQIISSDSENPSEADIELVINEAAALDHVLTERRRKTTGL